MKRIEIEHHYGCSPDHVYGLLSTEEAMREKYTALNARHFRVKSMEETDEGLHVDTRREVPLGDDIPKGLRKFAGEYNRVRQRETWSAVDGDGYHCTVRVDLDGIPVRIGGEMRLSAHDSGSVNTINLEVSCSVPFIGKMATEYVAGIIEQQIASEHDYIKEVLTTV